MKYLEYILKNSFNILFKNTSVPNEKIKDMYRFIK